MKFNTNTLQTTRIYIPRGRFPDVQDDLNLLMELCGGSTMYATATGTYMNEDGDVVTEPVVVMEFCHAFAVDFAVDELVEHLLALGEEAVLVVRVGSGTLYEKADA